LSILRLYWRYKDDYMGRDFIYFDRVNSDGIIYYSKLGEIIMVIVTGITIFILCCMLSVIAVAVLLPRD